MGSDVWRYNMRRVVVVDVTDDYAVTLPPLPTECYPVLAELWVPAWHLPHNVGDLRLVDGYLYDWHESPEREDGTWFVGVVNKEAVVHRPFLTPKPGSVHLG
ncbi:MAG: hypothetical protein ABUL72_01425 [Armatimonadota bacterium]